MEHSKGKVYVIQGSVDMVNMDWHDGNTICDCYEPDRDANAERIAALWNAADGMTTEEAVDALTRFKGMLDVTRFLEMYMPVIKFLNTSEISIEEAVKYIKHGREMKRELEFAELLLDQMEVDSGKKLTTLQAIRDLLAKLEG